MREKVQYVWDQAKKHKLTLGVLGIALAAFKGFHVDSLAIWKMILVSGAVLFADILRKTLFPYLDLSHELCEKGNAAAAIFSGLFYLAVILAITTGI